MRYLVFSAAAALVVAGVATVASAQDDKAKGPGAEGDRPSPGAAQRAPNAGKSERKATQSEHGKTEPKTAQPQAGPVHPNEPKAAQHPSGPDKPKAAEHKQEPGKDQPKAAQQPVPSKQKSAAQKQEPVKEQPKTAEQAKDKTAGHVQVSAEQHSNIRERLFKETRVEKTKVNVTVNIGRAIPRTVHLHTLPVAIVAIAPAYRGYDYVVLEDDTILIVDPRTYLVVDLIPAGGAARAQLALSADQRHFLFTSLPKSHRADVHIRLALGAEVPRSIELLSFPSVAVERVPSVQRYRYIVSGDDIVIVDPSDYSVVTVISD